MKAEHSLDMLIADTEARVREEPENLNYRRSLATYYSQVDKYEDALRVLEEGKRYAGGSDPQIDQLISNIKLKQFDFEIAQCKENGDIKGMKAKEEAKEEFRLKDLSTRTERYPNDLTLRYEYGVLLYQNGKYNEAIQQLQIANKNARVRLRAFYYLGLCFYQKQQFDLAKEQLEKAASEISEMNDLKKEIYYMLGTILEQAGEAKNAMEYYKEIYQVDISYKDVAAKIEQAYSKK
jgi:tetratricopeptide (TPR) repeat protein